MPCTELLLKMKRVVTRSWIRYLLKAFDDFFEPRKHTTFERYRFNMRGQETGESFEQYITVLRQLAQRCAFATIRG